MKPIQFTIYGQPVSMKNGRRIVKSKRTSKMMFIRSQKALDYERDFLKQLNHDPKFPRFQSISIPVSVNIWAYYSSRRPDLDCELICDCLEKSGILVNDRLIHEKHFFKALDKENPRAEITIRKFQT